MIKLVLNPLRSLALATLLLLPACDGGKPADDKAAAKTDDKAAAKTDDKAAAKTDDKAAADPHAGHDMPTPEPSGVAELDADGRVEIQVDAGGYHPAEVRAPAKANVTLAFKRTTEAGCGQKVVIASMSIEKDLPLNEVVEIPVIVPESGELGFACGMNMYKGKVVPKG